MYFDDRNTARATRGRFRYQDECVALRCIANLASEQLTAVIVEWSADYIAVLPDGDPELVSVKHRDPGAGEWTMSRLREPLQDLHRVWQLEGERCTCAFASSAAVTTKTREELVENRLEGCIAADAAERERFLRVLTLPDPPLPRRTEITDVGIRAMGGVLSLLGRDDRHAEECYRVLVRRIERVAVEEPPQPEERIARLTGSLRAVRDRGRPDQAAQTLYIADLRDLVLATEASAGRRAPQPIRAAVLARPRGDREIEVAGELFQVVGEPEETVAPDRSWRLLRANARQTSEPARELRLNRLDVIKRTASADRRRTELKAEAQVHDTIPGLPEVLARDNLAFVTALPPGAELPTVYGRPPYPGIALDALVRALPQIVRTLESLHATGKAHRALRPEALIASRERLWLRDAGLATTEPAAGEGPRDYRAPEQERPLLTPPGPATDVFQLAAIVYHLATGEPPGPDPLPPGLLRPELAAEIEEPLMAGLAADPQRRPALRKLVADLPGGTVRC
jgi:hypothetical protein